MSGGGSNKAANEANAMEQQRQASIAGTQRAVNRVFDSPGREADIADYVSALRELQTGELAREKADADRQTKFALARNGQIGGGTHVDQSRRLAEAYGRGTLQVERNAQTAGSELRAADQDARARLISLATSGLDATTAATQASQAMRVNLESAKGSMQAASFGDVFSRFAKFQEASREAAERRRADRNAGWLYQPMGYGG